MKNKPKKKEIDKKNKIIKIIVIILLVNILLNIGSQIYNANKKIYVDSEYIVLKEKLDSLKTKIEKLEKLEEGYYTTEELSKIVIYFNDYYKKLSESKVFEIKKDGKYKNKEILSVILDTSLLEYGNFIMSKEYYILEYAYGDEKDLIRTVIYQEYGIKKTLIDYLKASTNNGKSSVIAGKEVLNTKNWSKLIDYDYYYAIYYSELTKCHIIINQILDNATNS